MYASLVCMLHTHTHTHTTHRKCIAKHMINPRISAVLSKTKPIAPFSCTQRVQEVHTKADVVHLTPGLLGLGVLFNCPAAPRNDITDIIFMVQTFCANRAEYGITFLVGEGLVNM